MMKISEIPGAVYKTPISGLAIRYAKNKVTKDDVMKTSACDLPPFMIGVGYISDI